MRTALAASAALLLAGTGFVHPADAQMAPQTPAATPQAQTQQSGTMGQTQPSGTAAQSQSWTAGQNRPGATPPTQSPSLRATGGQMGTAGQAPQGAYRTSCNDARMQGQTLIAFCRKPDGTWQTSAIGPVSQCLGDIQNVNGQLTCSETGVGSSTPPAKPRSLPAQQRY